MQYSAGQEIIGARPHGTAFIIDRDGVYLGVSTHDVNDLAVPIDTISGRTVAGLVSPALTLWVMSIIDNVLKTGTAVEEFYTLRIKDDPDIYRCRSAIISKIDAKTVLWDSVDITDFAPFVSAFAGMDPTERQVWMLSAQGLSTKQIATQMDIGYRSVTRYRTQSRKRFLAELRQTDERPEK